MARLLVIRDQTYIWLIPMTGNRMGCSARQDIEILREKRIISEANFSMNHTRAIFPGDETTEDHKMYFRIFLWKIGFS